MPAHLHLYIHSKLFWSKSTTSVSFAMADDMIVLYCWNSSIASRIVLVEWQKSEVLTWNFNCWDREACDCRLIHCNW